MERDFLTDRALAKDVFPQIPNFISNTQRNTRQTKNTSLKEFANELVERLKKISDDEKISDNDKASKHHDCLDPNATSGSVNIFTSTVCHKEPDSYFSSPFNKIDSNCASLMTRESPRNNSCVSGKCNSSEASNIGSVLHVCNVGNSHDYVDRLKKGNDRSWDSMVDLFDWIEICDKRWMTQVAPKSQDAPTKSSEPATNYNRFSLEDIERIERMAAELGATKPVDHNIQNKAVKFFTAPSEIPDLVHEVSKLGKYSDDDSSGVQTMNNHSDEVGSGSAQEIFLAYIVDSGMDPYVTKIETLSGIVLLREVKESIPRNVNGKRFLFKTYQNLETLTKSEYIEYTDDSKPVPIHNNKIVCKII